MTNLAKALSSFPRKTSTSCLLIPAWGGDANIHIMPAQGNMQMYNGNTQSYKHTHTVHKDTPTHHACTKDTCIFLMKGLADVTDLPMAAATVK